MPITPEFLEAKAYRDVLRRRRMLERADPDDREQATVGYMEALTAYQALKCATV